MAFRAMNISVEKLIYDPLNPRMPIKMRNKDESETIDYMLRNSNIVELMQSIAELGYSSAEPLLVVKKENVESYVVVEGNRRLTALKLLNNPQLAKVRNQTVSQIVSEARHIPSVIPCILYDNREEILNYLGYRHITGIKEWGSLEKARYLKELFDIYIEQEEASIYRTLAKMIGSRSDYVEKLLAALELYNYANDHAYFGSDINEEELNFSYFTTAIGNKSITNYINIKFDGSKTHVDNIKEENYKNIFLWMFDKKERVVKEIRQISTLAKVVDSERAIEKLLAGASLETARLYTTEPEEVFFTCLQKSIGNLEEAKSSIEQLSQMPEGYENKIDAIEKLAKTIRGAVQENFGINIPRGPLSQEDYEKLKGLLEKIK